jgi:sec-independent protein translocase protein TatA
MFGLGAQELIIILAIAFFIFGAKRLPEFGKGLGQGIRSFKTAITEKPQIEASPEGNNQENTTKNVRI